MIVLLIIEVAAGIAGYVLRDDIDNAIDTEMGHYMEIYNSSDSAREIFDKMQQEVSKAICKLCASCKWLRVCG